MSKGQQPAPATDPAAELKCQVREAAKAAGLTKEDVQAVFGAKAGGGFESGGAGAAKLGDGKLLDMMKRVFDFLMKLGPILGPIFMEENTDPAPVK